MVDPNNGSEVLTKFIRTLESILSDQLTRDQKSLHGTGATYDLYVMSQFSMGIPFVNPIMIIGEAKNHYHQVKLSNAREFLEAYIDFSQGERNNTKSSGIFYSI